MFSVHAILLDLVTETVVQVCQVYASHEVVLAICQDSYVTGGIVPRLADHNEQRNIIQKIPMENTNQRVFVCKEFGSNESKKNGSVVVEGNAKVILVLWLARILLLYSSKEQAELLEREY